ncbi:MAG: L-threonylcarbamoyladenylate synthase [Rikenellaceae bacterium]
MLVKIYNQNPNEKTIAQVVDVLNNDGVIIYPTDSVYAFGCSINSAKALERIKVLTGKDTKDISIMCADLSSISDYARIETPVFKLLKRNTPGPFTFILNSSNKVPDKLLARRKEIGVRISSNPVAMAIVEALGKPMITASVKSDEQDIEYITDPELIHETFSKIVNMVLDAGIGLASATAIVDCREGEAVIIREGAQELKL